MTSPFIWGSGGQKITPEQRQQAVARALANVQPIDNPMQGLAMMAQAGVDRYNANPLNQFPDAPGGGGMFGGIFGLGSRLLGNGGGLY